MSRQIVSDHNDKEDETVVKSLKKPVHRHVINSSTQSFDDADDDMSNLNLDEAPTRVAGDREVSQKTAPKKTFLGNEGPDDKGKIDFSRSPDSLDALIQYHESYKHPDSDEGFAATANKCVSKFNRVFSTKEKPSKVTEQEILEALLSYYKANPNPAKRESAREAAAPGEATSRPRFERPSEPSVSYAKMPANKSLKVHNIDTALPLTGEKFEICKILNCKNICVVQKAQGSIEENNVLYAACGNTLGTPAAAINPDGCPQEAPMTAKEQMALEMFKVQFNGDELKAKKFLYMTKSLYK